MLITAISPRLLALSALVTYKRCPSGEFAIDDACLSPRSHEFTIAFDWTLMLITLLLSVSTYTRLPSGERMIRSGLPYPAVDTFVASLPISVSVTMTVPFCLSHR